ncbi:nucleotidyltransferase domain-containing protein [Pyrococcus kukulkanii]|uniref:nucleotidyltransferase domain-containing protein n=1 Tax=Pyrococcus kukulkanii TaxID=1609559 RepID=UPI00356572E1
MEKKALALREFIKRVENKFGGSIESIVLFGSYARGDYDIDVLVVGDVEFDEVMEIVKGKTAL